MRTAPPTSCAGPVFRNRADVVFLVNGLAVALAESVAQFRHYHCETLEMLVTPQVLEGT